MKFSDLLIQANEAYRLRNNKVQAARPTHLASKIFCNKDGSVKDGLYYEYFANKTPSIVKEYCKGKLKSRKEYWFNQGEPIIKLEIYYDDRGKKLKQIEYEYLSGKPRVIIDNSLKV